MSREHRRAERAAEAEAAGHRHARLSHLIFEELDAIFRGELSDPNLDDLRIETVELSPDCRNARIWYAHASRDEAERGLERALPFIRVRLAELLQIKRVPQLHFEHDEYEVHGDAADHR